MAHTHYTHHNESAVVGNITDNWHNLKEMMAALTGKNEHTRACPRCMQHCMIAPLHSTVIHTVPNTTQCTLHHSMWMNCVGTALNTFEAQCEFKGHSTKAIANNAMCCTKLIAGHKRLKTDAKTAIHFNGTFNSVHGSSYWSWATCA